MARHKKDDKISLDTPVGRFIKRQMSVHNNMVTRVQDHYILYINNNPNLEGVSLELDPVKNMYCIADNKRQRINGTPWLKPEIVHKYMAMNSTVEAMRQNIGMLINTYVVLDANSTYTWKVDEKLENVIITADISQLSANLMDKQGESH